MSAAVYIGNAISILWYLWRSRKTLKNSLQYRFLVAGALMSLDLAILNVNCHTMDTNNPIAQAVGVEEGIIKQVGAEETIKERISSSTKIINGEGKTLLPSFSDSHTHFANLAVRMIAYFELNHKKSREEIKEQVKLEASKKEKGQWVTGIAWDESKWKGDKTFLTRRELDEIAPHHPVALIRVDGHIVCVNSKALEILDYEEGARGVEVENGEPTGRLVEDAGFNVRLHTEPGVDGIIRGLKLATKKAHSLGITALHDVWLNREKIKAYQMLCRENELQLRVGAFMGDEYLEDLIHLGLMSLGNDFFKILGIKLFVDGSIGASTAMVSKGYLLNPEDKGYPMHKREDLFALLKRAHDNDIQMAIHAIGDLAVKEVLDGLEEAGCKEKNLGHRIEHMELITIEEIQRMKDLGVTASMQPNFTGEWGHPGSMYEDRFGPEIIKTMNPLRWVLDKGVTLLLGSDGMPYNPLYGIHSCVNPPFSCQKITPLEAIRGYTRSGAGKLPGIIAPGGLGDMVLIDGDPVKEPERIKDMEVAMTIFHGRVVFER